MKPRIVIGRPRGGVSPRQSQERAAGGACICGEPDCDAYPVRSLPLGGVGRAGLHMAIRDVPEADIKAGITWCSTDADDFRRFRAAFE
jgi:hypothetical protein